MDSLAHFLSTPDAIKKIPHVVLIGYPTPGADGLVGAVLVYEYQTPLGGTRVFATGDGSGRRDVLASPGMRSRTAAIAARTLMERGAHIVHTAFCEEHIGCDDERDTGTGALPINTRACDGAAEQSISSELKNRKTGRINAEWTLREHEIPAYLPLLPTFDETLARIGAKTRTNLRYYRRRCERELGAYFVPHVCISLSEFLAFNRDCTYAVSVELATFRYKSLQGQPNQSLHGVRDGDGRWLSLIGVRNHSGFVEVDWQMNRANLPNLSVATVMRSYLIDYEISVGSTRLYMEGGTPHSIARSFLKQRIGELTVARDSYYVRFLERFGPWVFPPKNYVGQTLLNPNLEWKQW